MLPVPATRRSGCARRSMPAQLRPSGPAESATKGWECPRSTGGLVSGGRCMYRTKFPHPPAFFFGNPINRTADRASVSFRCSIQWMGIPRARA